MKNKYKCLYFPNNWHRPDVDTMIAVREMYETGSISKLLVKAYPDGVDDGRGIYKKYLKYKEV
jgi:hypothetical protein|tara:strand:- start:428 stop:616 length:189 start_codon:yes stop_codon:yes gene_type:complete